MRAPAGRLNAVLLFSSGASLAAALDSITTYSG